jgi:hypothetical protein
MAFGLYQFYLGIKGEEQAEVRRGTLTFFSKLVQKQQKKCSGCGSPKSRMCFTKLCRRFEQKMLMIGVKDI